MPRRRYPKGKSTRDESRSREIDDNWRKPLEKTNELFERYYKRQNFIPEEEWNSFLETIRTELPVVFRITGSRKHAQKLLSFMESEYMAKLMEGVEVDGERVAAPRRLTWYPDGLAFQLDASRRFVRKSDELRRFHAWLVSETEAGNVSRQEAVSMLPPLLLDVAAGQLILDVCAAPGSKTAQILELLGQRDSERAATKEQQPGGLIVANDVDGKRCYLMVHQVKRLHSPNVVVINHDGTNLPNLFVDRRIYDAYCGGPSDSSASDKEQASDRVAVRFDRVLCDVPCSGDGTMRKNPDVWSRWAPGTAISLHGVQVRLLRRALELARVGGRVVYSTCSLNPVENEAVVASLLRAANYDADAPDKHSSYTNCIEVVDCSAQLEGLKRIGGLTEWTLMDKTGTFYDQFEQVPERMQRHFRPSMFPPQPSETALLAELRKCIRVCPHYQNTGGFFVCVLQKHSELSWQRARPSASDTNPTQTPMQTDSDTQAALDCPQPADAGTTDDAEPTATDVQSSKRLRVTDGAACATHQPGPSDAGETQRPSRGRGAIRNPGFREPPFRFLNPGSDERDAQLAENLRSFFGFSTDFRFDQLFARGERAAKTWANMYLANEFVRALVVDNADRVHFVNLGMRALIRNEDASIKCACDYRIAQEALITLDRFVGQQRRLLIGRADSVALLSAPIPPLGALSLQTREVFDRLSIGPVVLECFYATDAPPSGDSHDGGEDGSMSSRFLMGGWRGRSTLRAYLPMYERRNLLALCGVHQDPAELQKNPPAGGDSEDAKAPEAPAGSESGDGADVDEDGETAEPCLDEAQQDATPTVEAEHDG